jgi:hypothetical protein
VVIDSGMQNLAARVAAKIEEGDVRGSVSLTASNDTLAAYDDDTVAALRQLHPSRHNVRSTASASRQRSGIEVIGERYGRGYQVILGWLCWWTGWSPNPAS